MKKYIIFILVFVLFPVYCFGSTVLYRQQEPIFSYSADVVSTTFNTEKQPIISNKNAFLAQIENETDFLYILSHGLPNKGIMISKNERVPWNKVAEHVQADVLIVDTCFSGQILEQKNWLEKPSIIITSTEKNNYSYNPKLAENYRISLLSAAFFIYFCAEKEHEGIEDYLGLKLSKYNERIISIFGINSMLRDIKYLHLKLYAGLIINENFISQIKKVEDSTSIPFKGFSSIQYEIGE